ncbi:MAG: sorbosone dehydrogenase family protein [Verrucomicrobiaceae bacterium]|nr:MAG: sorbosone dehydrogenase family protein [Verrucomicrobiaceae bacterium]
MKPTRAALIFLCMSPAVLSGQELVTDAFTPEPIRLTIADLPAPDMKDSANKRPEVVDVPEKAVLQAPEGFRVELYAENVADARWLALTPDGDVLLAHGKGDRISLLRDTDGDGKPDRNETFADKGNKLNMPFGMAFTDGHFHVGNTDAVRRYPWKSGQLKLEGEGAEITRLPGKGYNQHWTRNVVASPDGGWLYVSVGSESNADPEESPRASVLRMKPDGSERTVFAHGLRNPVGLDFHLDTRELFTTVNERDKLGDGLVPDYLTQVKEGGFYGWPYAYLSPAHLDPRRMKDGRSEQPGLAAKTLTPDLLFEAHSAALGLSFARPGMFPDKYAGGAFVAFRGSWNRNKGTGYKIVFVPFKDGRPAGHYEDFVKGFLIDPDGPKTWGRPVGVLSMPDGSLLFSEESNGRLYRVTYKK